MGFFSDAVSVATLGLVSGDELFGDQGEGAAKAQAQQNAADKAFLAEQVARARGDIGPLFTGANRERLLGSQGALDVFRGALPQQLGAFQQGNLSAQQALLGGQFTPQLLQTDTSFIPSKIPDFLGFLGGSILKDRT